MDKLFVGLENWKKYFDTVKTQVAWNHAYVISGPQGVGKRYLAKYLIKQVLCTGDYDGLCNSCKAWRKDELGQAWHPDLVILKPDEKTGLINIEKVRHFLKEIAVSPTIGARRVALVSDLSLINVQGFNALLKTLEEPPKHLVFIGLINNFDALPKTVASRVYHCAISPTNQRDLVGYLSLEFSREDSSLAANLSYGRPAWAEKLLRDKIAMKKYNEEARQFIKDFLLNKTIAFNNLESITSNTKTKQEIVKLLNHWGLLLRDIILVKSGQSSRVGHKFLLTDLEKLSERGNINTWFETLDALLMAIKAIEANGHRRLQLGNFILTIP